LHQKEINRLKEHLVSGTECLLVVIETNCWKASYELEDQMVSNNRSDEFAKQQIQSVSHPILPRSSLTVPVVGAVGCRL
jgi:hypothetical protein